MSRIVIRVLWLTLISGLSLQGCTPPKPVRLGAPLRGTAIPRRRLTGFL